MATTKATLMDAGWTCIPSTIILRQQALGLDPVDMNIVLVIAAHWWKADQLAFPSKKLNKQAVSIVGDREALQQVDQARLERMRALNDAVRNLELVKQGPTLAQRVRGEGSSRAAGSGQ